MKNHFYSTLRRELRKLLRKAGNGKAGTEPKEVSVACIEQLCHDYDIPYDELDNENVRDLMMGSGGQPAYQESPHPALYSPGSLTIYRRRSARLSRSSNRRRTGEDGSFAAERARIVGRRKRAPRSRADSLYESRLRRRRAAAAENEAGTLKLDSPQEGQKLYIIENDGTDDGYKIISQKNMDDVDLLVNIHNSIVCRVPSRLIVPTQQDSEEGAGDRPGRDVQGGGPSQGLPPLPLAS